MATFCDAIKHVVSIKKRSRFPLKRSRKSISRFQLIVVVLVAWILTPVFRVPSVNAAPPTRVLILPFDIYADKDLSFLVDGIANMLATRLTIPDRVMPFSREETAAAADVLPKPIARKDAVQTAKALSADYVLFGSLTVFGDSISTDIHFIETVPDKTLITFYETGKNNSDVIEHVNRFAERIRVEIFDETPLTAAVRKPSNEPEVVDTRRHPEALWASSRERRRESAQLPASPSPADTPSSPAEKPAPSAVAVSPLSTEPAKPVSPPPPMGALWKSREFDMRIIGIALDDLTGDGRLETVFITEKKLFIYRYHEGGFGKLGAVAGDRNDTFLTVDTADLNGNGQAEIFVTNLIRKRSTFQSFVLEWDGARFTIVDNRSRWLYRVIDGPHGSPLLIGQRFSADDRLMAGVHELKWNAGVYASAGRINLPRGLNVTQFTYGDVFNDGRPMIVSLTKNDHIRIMDLEGNVEWNGSEYYGGSYQYIEVPDEAAAVMMGGVEEKDRIYLSQRLFVGDVSRDGKNELVVVKNTDAGRRLFSKQRFYKSGTIECLRWDRVGFFPKWQARKISGYISDYRIGDLDADGVDELVFSVVEESGLIFGKTKSYIVAQTLPASSPSPSGDQ
jgi:hypothetical protein